MVRGGRILKSGGLVVLWMIGVALVLRSYWAEPPPSPNRHFATDTFGSVLLVLGVMAIETGVLYAILRPWTYRRSVQRSLPGLAIFVPWTLFLMFRTMHAGNALLAHWMWLGIVDAVLLICVVASSMGRGAAPTG
jgi:hypothetical protein